MKEGFIMPKTMKELMETDMNGAFSQNESSVEPEWLISISERVRTELGIGEEEVNGPLDRMILDLEMAYTLYGYIKGFKLAKMIEEEIKDF